MLRALAELRENAARQKDKFFRLPRYGRVFISVLAVALTIYLLTAFIGGGDAFNGRHAEGKYFFKHHDGAPEHEVSRFIFYLNLWDFGVLAALWAIGLIAGAFVLWRNKTAR